MCNRILNEKKYNYLLICQNKELCNKFLINREEAVDIILWLYNFKIIKNGHNI